MITESVPIFGWSNTIIFPDYAMVRAVQNHNPIQASHIPVKQLTSCNVEGTAG